MTDDIKIVIEKHEHHDSGMLNYQVIIGRTGILGILDLPFPSRARYCCGLCVGEARAIKLNDRYYLEMTQDCTDTSHEGSDRRFSRIDPGITDSREEACEVLARYARMRAEEVFKFTHLAVEDLTLRAEEGKLTEAEG